MKMQKEDKVIKAVGMLTSRLHLVEQKANGHIRVNNCDFWCTTEKYYNPATGEKGTGFRNFIEMIERK